MSTPAKPALLDVAGVAERLGISVRFVRRLVAERRIEFIKVGHLLRFDPEALDDWIDRARVEQLWPPPPTWRRGRRSMR